MKTRCILLSCTALVLIFCVGCAGEGPAADMTLQKSKPINQAESGARASIERVGVFEDELAYGKKRGIYIIRDTLTGKEYMGVSGIGMAETGSHEKTVSQGKTTTTETVPDER